MYRPIIDAHIHFDLYKEVDRKLILQDFDRYNIKSLLSVSNDLESAQKNLAIAKEHEEIKTAFGFHPEQHFPGNKELSNLLDFIKKHDYKMVAIGEVGLPYYLRKKNPEIPLDPYIDLLEVLIKLAITLDKPIVLHAIYEDARIVCDLLEKYSVEKAHFHWFKGDKLTIERMISNGYFISITPDVLYEEEIQALVRKYPLSLMMVETDGPWQFSGPFKKQLTHPKMIHQAIKKIASIKKKDHEIVYRTLYGNTKQFYNLGY